MARALAEIIKLQIDSALETRMTAAQEAGKTQASDNSDKAIALKKSLALKREEAKPALKKAAKTAQKSKNTTTTSKPAKKAKTRTRTSARSTQTSGKPIRKQTKKTTGTADD